MTVRPGNADLPLADVMLRDMRRIGMPAAAPIPSTRRDGKGDRRFRAAFGGVWLGAYPRKSVPFCSILFRFLSEAWAIRVQIWSASEAQMDANETLLEREWDGRPAGAEVVASARLHMEGMLARAFVIVKCWVTSPNATCRRVEASGMSRPPAPKRIRGGHPHTPGEGLGPSALPGGRGRNHSASGH